MPRESRAMACSGPEGWCNAHIARVRSGRRGARVWPEVVTRLVMYLDGLSPFVEKRIKSPSTTPGPITREHPRIRRKSMRWSAPSLGHAFYQHLALR